MGPLASPSPGSRSQFPQNSNVKVTRIHPSQSPNPFSHPLAPPSLITRPLRAQTPNFQTRQFSPNQISPLPDFSSTPSPNSEPDPYLTQRTFANQSPRAAFSPQSPRPAAVPARQTVMFTEGPRRPEENFQVTQPGQSPEVTRQLRDLLQRQKEGNTVTVAGNVQRQWPAGTGMFLLFLWQFIFTLLITLLLLQLLKNSFLIIKLEHLDIHYLQRVYPGLANLSSN